jgi:hypothetical protein
VPTPLELVARDGDVEQLRWLAPGADPTDLAEALGWAAECGQREAARVLLAHRPTERLLPHPGAAPLVELFQKCGTETQAGDRSSAPEMAG